MRCPRCNGKRCEPDNSGYLVWRACKMCHGTGIVPDNNENWFCSLPTEEKAKVLETIIIKYLLMKQPKCYEITKREFWELWLKEKHNEMSSM